MGKGRDRILPPLERRRKDEFTAPFLMASQCCVVGESCQLDFICLLARSPHVTQGETFVLLKFEVPSGYTAGINPGQHVKVHVPTLLDLQAQQMHGECNEKECSCHATVTRVLRGILSAKSLEVKVPNPSKGFKEWNKGTNLEEPVEILSSLPSFCTSNKRREPA